MKRQQYRQNRSMKRVLQDARVQELTRRNCQNNARLQRLMRQNELLQHFVFLYSGVLRIRWLYSALNTTAGSTIWFVENRI